MQNYFLKVKGFALTHKFWAALIALAVIWGGYTLYGKLTSTAGEIRYVVANATQGTIITTVTGSGQVATLNQVDVKPKVSGEIVSVPVLQGQVVSAGQAVARLDATSALKAVRDAEVSLESAELSLEKTLQPPDELSLTQSQNSLANSITSKQNAEDTLAKNYNDGFNEISNAFLDLPGVVSGLHDLLFNPNSQLGGNNVNNIDYYSSSAAVFDARGSIFGQDAANKYQIALAKYNKNFTDYKALDRGADPATIEVMLAETYDTSLAIADAVKSSNNLIQFFVDQMTQHSQKIPTLANTQLATMNTYTGTMNSHLSSLISLQNSIKIGKNNITDSTRQAEISTLSLAKLKAGADPLDIRNQQITITQRKDALLDAQITLSNYTVKAPFSGTIAKVSAKIGDTAGNGTAVVTLTAKEKIAQLSLNEVDAAKVQIGQKVILAFDAVDGLSLTGKVATIDTLGTVSQGVVTYAVQINFDAQDDRVKSGMSVNATIQTNVKTDVLTIPSSAVKLQGNTHYVEVFDSPISSTPGNQGTVSAIAPRRQTVEIGLADESLTEITSGLKNGDQVVTRTITTTTSNTQTAPSIIGGGSTRGGGIRIPGG